MPDAHANFAVSQVAAAPTPALSGLSLSVQAGHGARFPATPFNAPVWPNGVLATPLNAEIVRVSGVAGDVLTIARAQEGSSARSIIIGDQIAAAITAKTLADIEMVPVAASADVNAAAGQCLLMSGTHNVALPSAPTSGAPVAVVALSGVVTINRGGTDTINVRGSAGNTSCSIPAGSNLTLQYLGGVWYVVSGGQTLTPSPWTAVIGGVGLTNSWIYSGSGGPPAFMKDPLGFVRLRGRIKGGANGSAAFALPVGSRPAVDDIYPAGVNNSGVPLPGFVIVQASTGNVMCYFSGTFTDIGLDGVTFLAEN